MNKEESIKKIKGAYSKIWIPRMFVETETPFILTEYRKRLLHIVDVIPAGSCFRKHLNEIGAVFKEDWNEINALDDAEMAVLLRLFKHLREKLGLIIEKSFSTDRIIQQARESLELPDSSK